MMHLQGDVCGKCGSFNAEAGRCEHRNVLVKQEDIACQFFY
jgi:hypothetical protein